MDSASDPDPRADAVPVPLRFWWLKRLSMAGAALIVGLVLLRVWWGYEADRRLQAQIDEYRAAGQLVDVEEFNAQLDAVPDDQNAALLYELALAKYVDETKSGVLVASFTDDPALFGTNLADAEELVAANAETLRLIRKARDRPQVAWSDRITGSAVQPFSGLPGAQRSLAKLLWLVTEYRYRIGDHAGAMESLRDFTSFSEAVAAHPTLISTSVAWGCQGLALRIVEQNAAGWQIGGDARHPSTLQTPSPRTTTELVIQELLDEKRSKAALVHTYYCERAQTLDFLTFVRSGLLFSGTPLPTPVWTAVRDWAERPILDLDYVRVIRKYSRSVQATVRETWPAAARLIPSENRLAPLVRRLSRPVSRIDQWGPGSSLEFFFGCLARRQMAATALAVRLYVVDNGVRPKDLGQLVPDYLPRVPADPMAPEERAIGYDLEADHPVLYSVGRDGRDDGGVFAYRADGRRDYAHGDILFFLDGRSEASPSQRPTPSPQTVDDDKKSDEAGREQQ